MLETTFESPFAKNKKGFNPLGLDEVGAFVLSCLVLSYPVPSSLVLCCPVPSHPFLSCLVLSCLVQRTLSSPQGHQNQRAYGSICAYFADCAYFAVVFCVMQAANESAILDIEDEDDDAKKQKDANAKVRAAAV